MNKHIVGFGSHKEQQIFLERHKPFFDRLGNLRKAQEMAFLREIDGLLMADKAVFYLGRLCVEDFSEIMLLASNGYGNASMKLLRGMYEKAVTARYLHQNPDKTEHFFDFYWVNADKLVNSIEKTYGPDSVRLDRKEEIEKEYSKVREKFMIADCKKCNSKKLNYTWSDLDFVSMAHKVESLRKFIIQAYYIPTLQLHPTPHSIARRLEVTENSITFKHGAQREDADNVFFTSHELLLNVIDLQREHFDLKELESQLKTCNQDFVEICKDTKKI